MADVVMFVSIVRKAQRQEGTVQAEEDYLVYTDRPASGYDTAKPITPVAILHRVKELLVNYTGSEVTIHSFQVFKMDNGADEDRLRLQSEHVEPL